MKNMNKIFVQLKTSSIENLLTRKNSVTHTATFKEEKNNVNW